MMLELLSVEGERGGNGLKEYYATVIKRMKSERKESEEG